MNSPINLSMKMSSLIHGGITAALLSLACSFAPTAPAQDNVGPLVYTVGTTWHEMPANRDWAYLLWLGSDPALVGGKTYAIYGKPGDASSASPYQRRAITATQTDTHVIEPLLQRAASIGENLVSLEVDIDALFGKFIPAGLTRAGKISAVLRGAVGDPAHYGKVMLLARTHPSVAMSLGVAIAEPIGAGLTTFEIREFNPATQQDIAVIGRVTVQAGAPTVLPAPGMPVQVPKAAARGDLNVGLRWGTPDSLRRLALLQHGYNVWRVRKDYAEAPGRQWHLTPPTGTTIAAALSSTSAVRRVNTLPLVTSKIFTLAEALNFTPPAADTNTVFATDADDRGKPGYIPTDFTNGSRFYYFVSARDILGRDGLLSPGTNVMICDQLPPHALDKVEVVNDYVYTGGSHQHFLRVNWTQPDNATNTEEKLTRYWVYRWTNISELHTNQANPVQNLIGIVNHDPLKTKNTFLDNGPTAPNEATALIRTYYYTVRSEDNGACGGNLSPHSAPVAGALRDRVGPAGPTGTIRGQCLEPRIVQQFFKTNIHVTPQIRTFTINIHGIRIGHYVNWLELWAEVLSPLGSNVATYAYGQYNFPPGVNTNDWMFTIPSSYESGTLVIHARCKLSDGQISSWNAFSQPLNVLSDKDDIDGLELNVFSFAFPAQEQRNCGRHYPVIPGINSITPIEIDINPTPTTREMRLYRRIDDGPLQLICQKTNAPNILALFTCQDDSFPPLAAEACYFAQLYDEHGNPSPMVRLGCIQLASPVELPRPMLAPLTPQGDNSNPKMLIRWFCPPAGVERFEVAIAAVPPLATNPANGLLIWTGAEESHTIPPTTPAKDGKIIFMLKKDFQIFRTPRIGNGSSFGDGAQFNLTVDVAQGGNYHVFVRAVGKDGAIGPRSNFGRLSWAPPTTNVLPTVDWPARSLPVVSNSFPTNFMAQWLLDPHNAYTGAVIMIGGETNVGSVAASDFTQRPQILNTTANPLGYLFTNSAGLTPFPMVLYRYQVPNLKFPSVSGDIIQASPMMENIALERTNSVTVIHDPFIIYDGYLINFGNTQFTMLMTYLKDTQPVVSGSRYKYLLVRFQRDGEIAEVIPTNEVDVP